MLHLHSQLPPVIVGHLNWIDLVVDEYWGVKVASFNLATCLGVPEGAMINPYFLAPEVLAGNPASTASVSGGGCRAAAAQL